MSQSAEITFGRAAHSIEEGPNQRAHSHGDGVSVIVTVRNDREGLAELLPALAAQSEAPDEIVIVDGGSYDETLRALEGWTPGIARLTVIEAPGSNIAAGRNIAVRTASHDWIVSTDAGCRPVPGWLAAFKRARQGADIAAGVFVVDAETPFEEAVAFTHYPLVAELGDGRRFIRLSHRLFGRDFRAYQAGGRSMAFSRRAWESVGGFPEVVYAGEDLAFSAAAVAHGFRAVLVPQAVVHWRPRTTWAETARMFRTYARGDIRTPGRGRHVARVLSWSVGSLILARGWPVRFAVAASALAYMGLPLQRARRFGLRPTAWWRIPALIAVKDLAQMIGSVEGVVDQLHGRPQPNPHPPPAGRLPGCASAAAPSEAVP